MPAEHIDRKPGTSPNDLEATFHTLKLQQPVNSSSSQPVAPTILTSNSLSSPKAKSLQEPPAPAKCTSPRISSHPARPDSRAAINLQASKSPLARSAARQGAVRRSADAVLMSGSSTASRNPKATAFRQARQRNSVQLNAASSREDDVIAAVRRSRMRIEKIGINRDSAHERKRLEVYALNTILRASEEAKLQQLIKQHACSSEEAPDSDEQERMSALAALPDSDDDKYQASSPRTSKSGALHKV